MNPQDPYSPASQPGQPQQPQQPAPVVSVPGGMVSPGPMPMPQQSQGGGKKWLLVVIIVVVVALLAGAAYFVVSSMTGKDGPAYSKQGDASLGALKAGDFNYINACDVFTADDLDKITGKTSDRLRVTVQFAEATDNAGDPMRTYRSECRRTIANTYLMGDLVTVTVKEYSSPAVHEKHTKLHSARGSDGYGAEDPSLVSVFGAAAKPVLGKGILYLTIDNKEISINMKSVVEDKAKMNDWAVAIAKMIQQRVGEVSVKKSVAPDYSKVEVNYGAFPYQQACSLWGVADFKGVMNLDPDEGEIRAEVAEESQAAQFDNLSSKCIVNQKPAKTELDTGDLSSLNDASATVQIETVQHFTVDRAVSSFGFQKGTPVSGVGDQAVIRESTTGGSPTLVVRKGHIIATINIFRSQKSTTITDAGDADRLTKIGQTIAGRVQ